MPETVPCVPNCCTTVPPTEIPGPEGDAGLPGTDGDDGINAFTTLTSTDLELPAAAGPVTTPAIVTFVSTLWMAVGQKIIISDPNGTDWGTFEVLTLPSGTSATLEWLDYAGDAAGTTPLAVGSQVSASGTQPVLAAPLPNVITDNSTGTASDIIAAGAGIYMVAFFIDAATIANGDLLTNYVPGHAFKILKFDARCAAPVTTGAKASTLNLEIDSTNLTGGVISLAGTYALGAAQAGSAVTATNTGTALQSFSIEASATTAFVEGSFWLIISIQNMDTADAIASLADHVNDLVAALS